MSNKSSLVACICAILFIAILAVPGKSAELIAGYNENSPNLGDSLWPYSIGWLWDAPVDFTLTRVETKFGSGEKEVTIVVYDDLPQQGGQLLASADYDALGGSWGGADLGPLTITAGENYLIGFCNVVGLGPNFTGEAGQEFSSDGYMYYSPVSDPPPSFTVPFLGQDKTIIRIYGEPVPEPSTLIMLTGLGVMLAVGYRKRLRPS
ncbi:MAG: PEP-CTERM sorting domain-containing protein [Thermoguttaceae bacterium]